MILGDVTEDHEVVLVVEGLSAQGSVVPLKVVLDTGFNGYLTLPQDCLTDLDAREVGTRRAALGDGNIIDMSVYLVSLNWHGKEMEVMALEAESAPLAGMSLLWGSRIVFEARVGGTLEIEPLEGSDEV